MWHYVGAGSARVQLVTRTSLAGGSLLALTGAGTLVLGILVSLVYDVAVAAQHGVLPPA